MDPNSRDEASRSAKRELKKRSRLIHDAPDPKQTSRRSTHPPRIRGRYRHTRFLIPFLPVRRQTRCHRLCIASRNSRFQQPLHRMSRCNLASAHRHRSVQTQVCRPNPSLTPKRTMRRNGRQTPLHPDPAALRLHSPVHLPRSDRCALEEFSFVPAPPMKDNHHGVRAGNAGVIRNVHSE